MYYSSLTFELTLSLIGYLAKVALGRFEIMILYYLDVFTEINGGVLSHAENTQELYRVLKAVDSSVIRIHWGALVAINGRLVGELWVEARSGLLRALISDHDKASLLRLWGKIDRLLREDYERFIGIILEVREVGLAHEVIGLVMHDSGMLGEEVKLLSKVQASELPKVRRLIHLQPWEGLLILELNDEVSIYKASRVALKQAIPEFERRYKLEVEILGRSFLEA